MDHCSGSSSAPAHVFREAAAATEVLPDHELVGMVLDREPGNVSLPALSKNIISLFSGRALTPVTPEEICLRCDLTQGEASRLAASIELAKRLLWPDDGRRPVRSPQDACQAAASIRCADKEHFLTLYLDARNVLIYEETISIGSLNANIVHPREVFRPAISHAAAAVILIHNHPSGDVSPSAEDLNLTSRLVEAGRLIGIEVLDHIIVSRRRFLSFRSESYL